MSMADNQEKFGRAIREILRSNNSRGFVIGAPYPKQDTSDMAKRMFDIIEAPDLSIPNAAWTLYECAKACAKDFRWEADYQRLAQWMENPGGRGALIHGCPGSGKTFLATIFTALAYMHHGALFTLAIAQEMNDRAEELKRDRLLLIDDIGVEDMRNNYGNRSYVLSDLVDVAERKGSILVLTTNLDASQLVGKYGNRTYDRLAAITTPISFAGTPTHRRMGSRAVFPVPAPQRLARGASGARALKEYWDTIPEDERFRWEEHVTHTDRGDVITMVPKHPVAHFARLLGLTDMDIPLPGIND